MRKAVKIGSRVSEPLTFRAGQRSGAARLVGVEAAAWALGINESTLWRRVARGAPVARRGSRGRGRSALFDVAALRAWERRQGAQRSPADGESLTAFLSTFPELLADALDEAHRLSEGPHKRALAGSLEGTWYLGVAAIRKYFGAPGDDQIAVPHKIRRLARVFVGSE